MVLGSLKASQAHRQDVLLQGVMNRDAVQMLTSSPSTHRSVVRLLATLTDSALTVVQAHISFLGHVDYTSAPACTLSGRSHVPYRDEHMYPIRTSTCTLSASTHVRYRHRDDVYTIPGRRHVHYRYQRASRCFRWERTGDRYLQYGLTDLVS